MAHKGYEIGADFERRCKRHFEKLGYYVVKSAGSKGIVDLVCLNRNGNVLVQCRVKGNLSKDEELELIKLGAITGCRVLLAYREGIRMEFRNI